MNSKENFIKDTDDTNFVSDVIEASNKVPVIVDFWAPWCEPCKKLTPNLEKNIINFKGKVKLVKINIDENQGIASQLRIQSIPAVYAFFEGKPIDGFMGIQTETKINEFISGLILKSGGDVDDNLENLIELANQKMEKGLIDEAEKIYKEVIEKDNNNILGFSGLIKTKILAGNYEEAQNELDLIPKEIKGEKIFLKLKAEIALALKISGARTIEEITSDLFKDPQNLNYIFELALYQISTKEFEDSIKNLLKIFKEDPNWENGKAKDQLLQLFDSLGQDNPLVLKGRRNLSSIIFS